MPPGKVAPAATNKLVVRVQRRIVFELGDLDAVFAAANRCTASKAIGEADDATKQKLVELHCC